MGCSNIICSKQSYDYSKQQNLLSKCLVDISQLNRCYSHDFVSRCHRNLILNTEQYILKYDKKLEPKQVVAYTIFEKWKLILYGSNIGNPNYVDCIGFDKQLQEERIAQKTYRFSKRNPFQIRLQDLYFHESYRQIEKDSGRVYLVPQIKQELFEKLLKKIANHFPESGYSLGINYIIGYFLLVGMSQMDSFWMFIHLALNQRFLALGFFQADLPLMKIVVEIFKNILRRKNKELYNQIYKNLEVDDTSWILKWVTSFFLSTFPIEFCHYIFDYVLTFGILGLSIVSFGIVNFFQNLIFKCEQSTDFILLFQRLLNFKYLSQSVPISQFMSSIYEITLQQRDFDLLGQLGDNFYVQYFILYAEWKFRSNNQSRQKMDQLLSQWYQQNINKRQNFAKMAQTYDGKFFEPNQKDDENKSFTNTNMQLTKQQKMAQKSNKEPSVVFHNVQSLNIKVPQQMRLSYLDNVQTIKVSSRHKKGFKQQQNEEKNDNQKLSNTQSFDLPLDEIQQYDMKKSKSQKYIKRNCIVSLRKIKSVGDKVENNESQSNNRQENGFMQKQNSQKFSIKSFSYLEKQSENFIVFNQKPLHNEVCLRRPNLAQTLRMRRQSQRNEVQVIAGQKTLNSSDNLTLFLTQLSKKAENVEIYHQPQQDNNRNGEQGELKLQDFEEYKNSVEQQQEEKVEKEIEKIFFKQQQQAQVREYIGNNNAEASQIIKEEQNQSIKQITNPIITEEKQNSNNNSNQQIQDPKITNEHNQNNQPLDIQQQQNQTIGQINSDNKIVRLSFSSAILDQNQWHHQQ